MRLAGEGVASQLVGRRRRALRFAAAKNNATRVGRSTRMIVLADVVGALVFGFGSRTVPAQAAAPTP